MIMIINFYSFTFLFFMGTVVQLIIPRNAGNEKCTITRRATDCEYSLNYTDRKHSTKCI